MKLVQDLVTIGICVAAAVVWIERFTFANGMALFLAMLAGAAIADVIIRWWSQE